MKIQMFLPILLYLCAQNTVFSYCSTVMSVDSGDSPMLFLGPELYEMTEDYACNFQKWGAEPKANWTVHFALHCTKGQEKMDWAQPCDQLSTMPFKVNKIKVVASNDYVEQNVTKEIFLRTYKWHYTGSEFGIQWLKAKEEEAKATALLIEISEYLNDNSEYRVFPNANMEFTIEKSTKDIWLAIGLNGNLNYLRKLGSKVPKESCVYDLYARSPPRQDPPEPQLLLMSFIDGVDFEDQYLESRHYTLHIPAGCSPTIFIEEDPTPAPDWWEEKQHLCEGTLLVATQAYLDDWRDDLDRNYHLSREIFCDELIDVRVELIGVYGDNFVISVKDLGNETIPDSTWKLINQEPPNNYSFPGVGSIKFYWETNPLAEFTGVAIRVYIQKTFQSTTTQIETTNELTSSNHNFHSKASFPITVPNKVPFLSICSVIIILMLSLITSM